MEDERGMGKGLKGTEVGTGVGVEGSTVVQLVTKGLNRRRRKLSGK